MSPGDIVEVSVGGEEMVRLGGSDGEVVRYYSEREVKERYGAAGWRVGVKLRSQTYRFYGC
jgi:hypothetical protein